MRTNLIACLCALLAGPAPLCALKITLFRPDVSLLVPGELSREKRQTDQLVPLSLEPSMTELELRELSAPLPPRLLQDAHGLTAFTAANSTFTSLPLDLFSYSPKITYVDLSYNNLESLPSEVFLGLSALETLLLNNNLLRGEALGALAPLASVTELALNNNPLGDICSFDIIIALLGLQQLRELDLSRTSATSMCRGLLSLRKLRRLNLSHNDVRSVACAHLRVGVAFFVEDEVIDLTDNPRLSAKCSNEDYNDPQDPSGLRKTQLLLDQPAECSCDLYRLIKMLAKRQVQVNLDCRSAWMKCGTFY